MKLPRLLVRAARGHQIEPIALAEFLLSQLAEEAFFEETAGQFLLRAQSQKNQSAKKCKKVLGSRKARV